MSVTFYEPNRARARATAARFGRLPNGEPRARVVDSAKSPSVNGSRWAVRVETDPKK